MMRKMNQYQSENSTSKPVASDNANNSTNLNSPSAAMGTMNFAQPQVFDDTVSRNIRMRLDYKKSFQDDPEFYPEFTNYPSFPVVPDNMMNILYGNNANDSINNIPLQNGLNHTASMDLDSFGSSNMNPVFKSNTSAPITSNNVINSINNITNILFNKQQQQQQQQQNSKHIDSHKDLLSLLAHKNMEKQNFQTKRMNYHQTHGGDPYLMN
ncbi:hypothetical protein KAFR_0D01260 [Kazachstania africana CBS 2517]|uniref:Uncharacterized protein n=1 Tax=Kazachstania africana (strain ATCC 22294 / BCRC 22015 / CBS 2517 / CECT 1963 / NBRC 1671 / NRRL Y-8276) TaxID=1071382 RepID=H2ATS2_KAZAF|nr:hypothetical protein KAFR_0D01260 [Kazachstania africana CBS 2517]CCF57772.1 hypothetical protein KAFR_0D01260 [Kazachstania africana CBS 2517]